MNHSFLPTPTSKEPESSVPGVGEIFWSLLGGYARDFLGETSFLHTKKVTEALEKPFWPELPGPPGLLSSLMCPFALRERERLFIAGSFTSAQQVQAGRRL